MLMASVISKHGRISIKELCHIFGVGPEEIEKDLTLLSLCGIPEYDPGDLIDVRWESGTEVNLEQAEYFERPFSLSPDEAMSLLIAGKTMVEAGMYETKSPLTTALEKIMQTFSREDRDSVQKLSQQIEIELGSYTDRWLNVIQEAQNIGKNVLLEYYSFSSDTISEREVEPLCLVWSKDNWYLIGWCHQAKERRHFRLDRIKEVFITENSTAHRQPEDSDLSSDLIGIKLGRKAYRVRVEFEKYDSKITEAWPSAAFIPNPDGSMTMEIRTKSLNWLANSLLRYGGEVEVKTPKKLALLIFDKASKLLNIYR